MADFRRHLAAFLPNSRAQQWMLLGWISTLGGLLYSRAALSLGVVILSLGLFGPGKPLKNVPTWILAGIAIWLIHLIGLLHTDNLNDGWQDLWKKLPFLCLPIALWRGEPLPARSIRGLLWFFAVACALSVLFMLGIALFRGITQGLSLELLSSCLSDNCEDIDSWIRARRWFTYSALASGIEQHPTYLSMILQAGFLAILWLWEDARIRFRPLPQWVMGILTGLIFLAIALLSSRMQQGIFVLVLFVTGGFLLKGRMNWKQFLIPLSTVVLLFVASQWSIPESRERISQISEQEMTPKNEDEWTGMNVRTSIWRSGWNLLQDNWLLGVGTGDVRDEMTKQYLLDGFLYGHQREMDPHNQYIATALATGVGGLLLLLSWLGMQGFQAIRTGKWPWLLWTAILALALLTESMLGRQTGIALATVIGPFLAYQLPQPGTIPGEKRE